MDCVGCPDVYGWLDWQSSELARSLLHHCTTELEIECIVAIRCIEFERNDSFCSITFTILIVATSCLGNVITSMQELYEEILEGNKNASSVVI